MQILSVYKCDRTLRITVPVGIAQALHLMRGSKIVINMARPGVAEIRNHDEAQRAMRSTAPQS